MIDKPGSGLHRPNKLMTPLSPLWYNAFDGEAQNLREDRLF